MGFPCTPTSRIRSNNDAVVVARYLSRKHEGHYMVSGGTGCCECPHVLGHVGAVQLLGHLGAVQLLGCLLSLRTAH